MKIPIRISKDKIESVYSAANSAIWYSHFQTSRGAVKDAREEDFVAGIVTHAIPMIAKNWIDILQPLGIELRVSGVFCHGHPQVEFGGGSRVELADLLVVRQHFAERRNSTSAMLVQAKMSTDGSHRLPTDDPQLTLFSSWPQFECVTGGLAPGLRNIDEVGKGSRYALVKSTGAYPEEIRWPDQCPWAACQARQELAAEVSFAKILGNMLLGKDGRAAQINNPPDDWSKLIKELLEVTGRRTFRRKNIGLSDRPRLEELSSVALQTLYVSESAQFGAAGAGIVGRRVLSEAFFASAAPSSGDGGNQEESATRSDDPGGGLSVLLIESRQSRNPEADRRDLRVSEEQERTDG